jgi:hypothetical protein
MKFAVAVLLGAVSAFEAMDSAEYQFMKFITEHGRSYATRAEYNFRLS